MYMVVCNVCVLRCFMFSLPYIFYGGPLGSIKKTRLYNVDPLKSHFYVVKLGFTGVLRARRNEKEMKVKPATSFNY